MRIDYLTNEDVIQIHDELISDYGGIPGVEINKLDAKLAIPKSGFGSTDFYPSIEEKAASYLYELSTGHCFKDGNKRTSYAATAVFLKLNGYKLIVDDNELYRFVLLVANDKTRPEFQEVVDWIKKHSYIQTKIK